MFGENSTDGDDAPADEREGLTYLGYIERDNYTCQLCGGLCHPRGDRTASLCAAGPERRTNTVIACDCTKEYDSDEYDRRVERAVRYLKAEPALSLFYTRALLRESVQKINLFAHSGRLLILRRTIMTIVFGCGFVIALAMVAGVIGSLTVSVGTGPAWTRAVFQSWIRLHTVLFSHPWIGVTIGGCGYFLHTLEREHHHIHVRVPAETYRFENKTIVAVVKREERPPAPHPDVFLSWPTWQVVAVAAGSSLVGGLNWILIRQGILTNHFGALVFWTLGTVGVGVLLKRSVRADVTRYGLSIWPVGWVFASRYGAVLGGITIGSVVIFNLIPGGIGPLTTEYILKVVTIGQQVVPRWGDPIILLLPGLIGLGYVARRVALVQSGRAASILHVVTHPLSIVSPIRWWLDDWPPNIKTPLDVDVSLDDVPDDGPNMDDIALSSRRSHPSMSYDIARQQAFERDEYTCQICGEKGYPYRQRGLAGWVSDGDAAIEDFRVPNIVTVCHNCLTELDRDELGQLATGVKQRHYEDTHDSDPPSDDSQDQ